MNISKALATLSTAVFVCTMTACAKPFDELPGEKYTGEASGGGCNSFLFRIAIHDGEIAGYVRYITARGHETSWNVTGTVSPTGWVQMTTETTDPDVKNPHVEWTGQLTGTSLRIAQSLSTSVYCHPPRSGTLTRR